VYQLDFRLRHADGWVWVMSRHRDRAQAGWQSDPGRRHQLDITRARYRIRMMESERSSAAVQRSARRADGLPHRASQVNDAFLEPGGSGARNATMCVDQLAAREDGGPLNQPPGHRARELLRKDGTRYPVMISGIRMKDAAGREVVWSVVQDISHRKAVERELADAARHDRLTGLANRQFMDRLKEAIVACALVGRRCSPCCSWTSTASRW
jgi:hypothetical protein